MTREELSELGVNDEAAAVIMQRFADETQAVRDAVQNAFARDAAIETQIRRAGGRSVRAVRAFLDDQAIVWDEGGLHGRCARRSTGRGDRRNHTGGFVKYEL